MLKDWVSMGVGLCALGGFAWGAVHHFATAADLQMVELRLDQKIVGDKVFQIQQRVWQLEDRNGGRPCAEWKSQADRDEYRKLQSELQELKLRQEKLMKK